MRVSYEGNYQPKKPMNRLPKQEKTIDLIGILQGICDRIEMLENNKCLNDYTILENIRDYLCKEGEKIIEESCKEAYIDGVLDFYNKLKG